MSTKRLSYGLGALGVALLFGSPSAHALGPEQKPAPPVAAKAGPALSETVTTDFEHEIPNLPGRKLVAVVVDYPPGAKSAPHRHAPSAFIYARVLSGAVRSQVGDAPARVYRTGESFYEDPGSHHRVSENASTTEPARLLAVFILADDENSLTTPEPK